MPVNVIRAAARIAPYLIDTCRITRDPLGERDETLNTTTLKYETTPPNTADTLIYTGSCLVVQEGGGEAILGGLPTRPQGQEAQHTAILPRTAPKPQPGDLFVVTAAVYDASLQDMKFRILSTPEATFLVARLLYLSAFVEARARRS